MLIKNFKVKTDCLLTFQPGLGVNSTKEGFISFHGPVNVTLTELITTDSEGRLLQFSRTVMLVDAHNFLFLRT